MDDRVVPAARARSAGNGNARPAEIELGAAVSELPRRAAFEQINLHWRGEDEAAMQRLDCESDIVAGPEDRLVTRVAGLGNGRYI